MSHTESGEIIYCNFIYNVEYTGDRGNGYISLIIGPFNYPLALTVRQ